MGTAEQGQVEEYFNSHFDKACEKSKDLDEFKEYLVNKASDNGIYLRYENVKEMFNNILKYYIKMFKLRKENELLKKEYEKRLNELLIHLKEEELKRKEEREYFLRQLEQERKIREEEKINRSKNYI